MDFKDVVFRNRSYRRFDEAHRIDVKTLESLIDLARLSSSGGNRQPLKFLIYNKPDECERIFPYLAWAGYLREWPGHRHVDDAGILERQECRQGLVLEIAVNLALE
jgi:nitroreductase